jgi:hypothetical protein
VQNATGTGNASVVQLQLSFTGNTDRADSWSYDDAGNLLYDERNTYTYDAENWPVPIYSNGSMTGSCLLDLGGQ